MRLLVITPMYYIEGREYLFHDSEAIHYLLSPLAKDNSIYVLNTYTASAREIFHRGCNYAKDESYPYEYNKDNIDVRMIKLLNLPKQYLYRKRQKHRIICEIEKMIEKNKPQVICVHFPTRYYGIIDKLNTKVPIVGVMHMTDIFLLENKDRQYKIANYLNSFYKNVYARSKAISQRARACNVSVSEQIIFSGVPVIKNRNMFIEDSNSYLYVGKLIKRKNVDLLIKAFIQLDKGGNQSNRSLVIVGSGPEESKLQKLAANHSNISFTGNVSRTEAFGFMERSSIFVMPSVDETLGLVYLEAMEMGCITVGTKGEGIDGIINNGENGFLVEPFDKSIEECLHKIDCLSEQERMVIIQKGIATAQNYSEIHAANNYSKMLYDNIGNS